MNTPDSSRLPVAVIGAGPVGLAAAAHLVERDLPVIVFESGPRVAAHLDGYRHVRLFSPWRYNVDKAAVRLLSQQGWTEPDLEGLPTAGEMIDDYLLPLSRLDSLASSLRVNTKVISVSRFGFDKVKTIGRDQAPFLVRVSGKNGLEEHLARAVIDASGTWSQPNPLGSHGLPAWGEDEHPSRIQYGMPDILGDAAERYRGKTTLVIGAGHSAAGNLLALASLAEQDPGTRLIWAVRGKDTARVFGGGEADELPARGALGLRLKKLIDEGRLEVRTNFQAKALRLEKGRLVVEASDVAQPSIETDQIIGATGARPDLNLTRELRTRHDPWLESTELLAPLIDPNVHSCGTVPPHGHRELAHPEPGFYAIGAKSYGRAPNFLMATGYEQARSVVAAIAGDLVSADQVELELPATGVCSSSGSGSGSSCCGGAPQENADACCALDEQKKAEGQAGCGCASQPKLVFHSLKLNQSAACCS